MGAKPMVYRDGSAGRLLPADFRGGGPFTTAAITGLWSFVFTAQGNTGPNAPANAIGLPDGAVADAGYVTWHDDGTEIMNSGRAPVSGSFCMGVWKQIGPRTYRLNHWALSWLANYPFPPGTPPSWSSLPGGADDAFQPVGPTNIQETITLDRSGNSYTGTFVLTQYQNNGSGKPINDISGAQIVGILEGTVTATRITVQ
ncbi:MAG: hypothetical protein ACRDKD_07025 [Solirubrobacteraceae bacterium]